VLAEEGVERCLDLLDATRQVARSIGDRAVEAGNVRGTRERRQDEREEDRDEGDAGDAARDRRAPAADRRIPGTSSS
jgi:hypothetical protein